MLSCSSPQFSSALCGRLHALIDETYPRNIDVLESRLASPLGPKTRSLVLASLDAFKLTTVVDDMTWAEGTHAFFHWRLKMAMTQWADDLIESIMAYP